MWSRSTRIVILEGPDCSGKTTLANSQAFQDFMYHHQGPYAGDPYHETLDAVGGALRVHRSVLFDRLHLGEQVYGPIYRGVDKLGDFRREILDGFLKRHSAVVVLCLPDLDVSLKLWRARRDAGQEMLTDEEQYVAVHKAYLSLKTTLPLVHYDFTKMSFGHIRSVVDNEYQRAYQSVTT